MPHTPNSTDREPIEGAQPRGRGPVSSAHGDGPRLDPAPADHDAHYAANRANWDERARIHARSAGYDTTRFVTDADHLSNVVAFDRSALGDLRGLDAVHLQCHIGTDTLSLARLGAASVTGLDQSPKSIAEARALFAATGTDGRFVVANLYDAVSALGATYDLVYTGVGALNWLPDIDAWAEVVASLLRPGGRLYLREGHPMLWSLDDTTDGSLRVAYPYFQTTEPMVFDETTTYADDEARLTSTRTYEWNHGLGEIVTAVLRAGLRLTTLDEHRGLEWQMLPHMEFVDGQWRLPAQQRDLVPLMYTLIAERAPAPLASPSPTAP